MTNDQTVVQIGRKRLVREPTQTAQNLAPPTQNPVSSAPVVLEEGRKAIRIGLLVVSVAFGGGGLLLGRAPLAGAVVASGTVKVTDNHKSVQHLEGGIVKEIRVRNGDRVAAGQTLIVLEDERTTAGLDLLAGQWDAAAAKAARLQAERDFQARAGFPGTLACPYRRSQGC
ncbi:MAG: biotin/lipoyl-binding protein [Candidatus Competibacter sp.]